MTKHWVLACVLCAVGCGPDSNAGSIYGDWLRSSGALVQGVTFETDGTYSTRTMQIVSPMAVNQQVETGTATIEPYSFSLVPSKWSCPEPSEPSYYEYSLDEHTLLVSGTPFERNDAAPDARIIVTLGCFDEDGAFTEYPLTAGEP